MPRSASMWALRGIVLAGAAILSACTGGIAKGKVYDIAKDKVFDITREAARAPVTIEPGCSVGPVGLDMTKEDVVRALGMPDSIFYGDTRFTLRDSPVFAHYVFAKAGLSVFFELGKIYSISVLSELYEYPGGIRVGIPASRAEEVLGKMPISRDFRGVSVYVVVYSGTAEYRLADFRFGDNFNPIALKVNEATGMITELRLFGEAAAAGGITPFQHPHQEEPLGEKEAKALRSDHMRVHRDSGIPLDRYALMRVRWTLRPVDNTVLKEYPRVEYWYALKQAERYHLAGKDAFYLVSDLSPNASPLRMISYF